MIRPVLAACCALVALACAAPAQAARLRIAKHVACTASNPYIRVDAADVRSITFFVDGRRAQKGTARRFRLPHLDRRRDAHFVGVLVRFDSGPRAETFVKVGRCARR